MAESTTEDALRPLDADVEKVLIANQKRFLAFLERRLGDSQSARDLLQSAFARAIESGTPTDSPGDIVNWFHAVLRNALTDHHRHADVVRRAQVHQGDSSFVDNALDSELKSAVCACMHDLLPTLKPEYGEVLREVDLAERPIADVAKEFGVTANNATVRLHRARQALKKQLQRSCGACATHGCLDCSCKGSDPNASNRPDKSTTSS
jgi:RNA polymerase sigma factor (sigma-70 family)